MGFKEVARGLRDWHNFLLAIFIPVLSSPLLIFIGTSEAKCGFCIIVIGLFWVLEIIPLAVTSLLPVLLFPMFGIMKASEVSKAYFKETLMLFLGSLIVAVAVEKWNLHKRLALRTLTLVGPQPRWLLLGVILPTWFLSMWMSNTATTAMMMPIVIAILMQIKECQETEEEEKETLMEKDKHEIEMAIKGSSDEIVGNGGEAKNDAENPALEPRPSRSAASGPRPSRSAASEPRPSRSAPSGPRLSRSETENKFLLFAKSFSLVTAYSANIGGVATLTGTPPNIIFKGLADGIYKNATLENPVNFANWLGIGLPLSVIMIILLWLWMQLYMEGPKCLAFWREDTTNYDRVRDVLRQEYDKLGEMSFAETSVAICFATMASLWITRKPGFIPGWGNLFPPKFVGDSTPAILAAVLLFILPARPPRWLWCKRRFRTEAVADDEKSTSGRSSYEALLDWETVNRRLAWGVLLLMGGGFALADGCQRSGLSAWVSDHFSSLSVYPTWVIALLLSIIVAMATEVTSNAATTTLFVPIVGGTAISMGVNPLVFMITCTIAASLAFLLPVATPPNAIVFSAGYLQIKDMITCGIPMNILSVTALNIMMNSWAVPLYDLNFFDPKFAMNSSGLQTVSTMLPSLSPSVASSILSTKETPILQTTGAPILPVNGSS